MIENIRRSQVQERSRNIERLSISWQVNAGAFYPYYMELEMELDCIIDKGYWGRTLRRGELVLGSPTPHKDFGATVTLP